jgi:hypothetical protein
LRLRIRVAELQNEVRLRDSRIRALEAELAKLTRKLARHAKEATS